jgi:hypothetical protein
LQGKLHRATPSQPSHKEVIGSLSELCATTIVDLEARLAKQKLWDEAEAKGSEKRGPIARLVAEREEKEKVERFRKMEQDKRDIEAAQRDLEVKRQALRIAERAADVVMDDVDDDDGQVGVSGAEEPQVRLFKRYIVFNTHNN